MSTEPAELVYPMIAFAIWTFLVMLRSAQVRIAAVSKGELSNRYFELFQGAEPPDAVVKAGNNVRNLFEFPVLFYAVCLAVIVTARADAVFMLLAWAFVACRIVHSVVHLGVNNVPVRFAFFLLSSIAVMTMWIRLALVL